MSHAINSNGKPADCEIADDSFLFTRNTMEKIKDVLRMFQNFMTRAINSNGKPPDCEIDVESYLFTRMRIENLNDVIIILQNICLITVNSNGNGKLAFLKSKISQTCLRKVKCTVSIISLYIRFKNPNLIIDFYFN